MIPLALGFLLVVLGGILGVPAGWTFRGLISNQARPRKVYRTGRRPYGQPSPQAEKAASIPSADTPYEGVTAAIPTVLSPVYGVPVPFWLPATEQGKETVA